MRTSCIERRPQTTAADAKEAISKPVVGVSLGTGKMCDKASAVFPLRRANGDDDDDDEDDDDDDGDDDDDDDDDGNDDDDDDDNDDDDNDDALTSAHLP